MKITKLTEDINRYEDTPYFEIASKSVMDSDGFYTDYTMYYDAENKNYFFILGDKDMYPPDPMYADWECDSNDEATEWYNNYEGFVDDDDFTEACDYKKKQEDLELEEDLFDNIPDVLVPTIEVTTEPSDEVPAGAAVGISDLLISAINDEWKTIAEYNTLIVNAEASGMMDIANIIKDITAEENNHVGMLQAALKSISPNVENIDAGTVEAEKELAPNGLQESWLLDDAEEANFKRSNKISLSTKRALNDIVKKYNGFRTPEKINDMWDELADAGVDVDDPTGTGTLVDEYVHRWMLNWRLDGVPVDNSLFFYTVDDSGDDGSGSTYEIYFS